MSPGIWYQYSSDTTEDVVISVTNSTFNYRISVFEGDSCDNLTCIAGETTFDVAWSVTEGGTSYILIHGLDGERGDLEFVLARQSR